MARLPCRATLSNPLGQGLFKMKKQEMQKMQEISNNLKQDLELEKNEGQIMFLSAVYDKRAECYQQIMTTPSKAYAVRGFMDAVKNPESHLNKYAEDFKLVLIGYLNAKTGKIHQKEVLETLVEASSIISK